MGLEIIETSVELSPEILEKAWTAIYDAGDETDPLEVLRAVVVLREFLRITEDAEVGMAREAGRSWTEIGGALGVSRQAAWEQFRDIT